MSGNSSKFAMTNLLTGTGNEYKACLHTHSTVSDGRFSPEELKAIYKKAGYSIVAFTDHELLRRHDGLADDSFLPLAGVEVALWSHKHEQTPRPPVIDRVHMNLIAVKPGLDAQPWLDAQQCARYAERNDNSRRPRWSFTAEEVAVARLEKHIGEHPDKSRYFDAETVRALAQEASDAGFLVALNHPVWSHLSLADADAFEGLWAVEVYNRDSELKRYGERDDFYDALLRGGRNPGLCCLATDDAHQQKHLCHGWVVIRAPRLDLPSVANALKMGHFYASTGPSLQKAQLENGVVQANTSPCATIRIIDAQGVVGMQTASGNGQSDWEFTLDREPHGYIRLVAEDVHGAKAWTMAQALG